jgi:hypothetical protein
MGIIQAIFLFLRGGLLSAALLPPLRTSPCDSKLLSSSSPSSARGCGPATASCGCGSPGSGPTGDPHWSSCSPKRSSNGSVKDSDRIGGGNREPANPGHQDPSTVRPSSLAKRALQSLLQRKARNCRVLCEICEQTTMTDSTDGKALTCVFCSSCALFGTQRSLVQIQSPLQTSL